jgi:hypothetical protein
MSTRLNGRSGHNGHRNAAYPWMVKHVTDAGGGKPLMGSWRWKFMRVNPGISGYIQAKTEKL